MDKESDHLTVEIREAPHTRRDGYDLGIRKPYASSTWVTGDLDIDDLVFIRDEITDFINNGDFPLRKFTAQLECGHTRTFRAKTCGPRSKITCKTDEDCALQKVVSFLEIKS